MERVTVSWRIPVIAAIAGIVLGVTGRLAMRWIALEAGLEGGGTWGGTLEVVAFGAIIGTPVALIFLLIRPRLALRAPWVGLLGGSAAFALAAVLPPSSARSALGGTPDTPAFTALTFWALLTGWMIGLDYVATRFFRR